MVYCNIMPVLLPHMYAQGVEQSVVLSTIVRSRHPGVIYCYQDVETVTATGRFKILLGCLSLLHFT